MMRQCRNFLSNCILTYNFKWKHYCHVTGCSLHCQLTCFCTQCWLMKPEILTDYDAAQTIAFLPLRWMPQIYAAILSQPSLLLWGLLVGAIPSQPSETLKTEVGVYAKLACCQVSRWPHHFPQSWPRCCHIQDLHGHLCAFLCFPVRQLQTIHFLVISPVVCRWQTVGKPCTSLATQAV